MNDRIHDDRPLRNATNPELIEELGERIIRGNDHEMWIDRGAALAAGLTPEQIRLVDVTLYATLTGNLVTLDDLPPFGWAKLKAALADVGAFDAFDAWRAEQ
jgi:hypothetical protein